MSQYPPPQNPHASWPGQPADPRRAVQPPAPGPYGQPPPGYAPPGQQPQTQFPQANPYASGYGQAPAAYPQGGQAPGYGQGAPGYAPPAPPQAHASYHGVPQAPPQHVSHPGIQPTQPQHASYHGVPQTQPQHASYHGVPQTQPQHPSFHGQPVPPTQPQHASYHGVPQTQPQHASYHGAPQGPGGTVPTLQAPPPAAEARFGAHSLPPRAPGGSVAPGQPPGRAPSHAPGGAPAGPAMQSLAGRSFGVYDLEKELGRGGMGIVYKAFHRDLRRPCALKTLLSHGGDQAAMDRFVQEGRSSAKLGKHPNIVGVFDAGIIDGVPYIAMEFVTGTPLDKLTETQPLTVAQALEYGHKIALALDHAHRCGIVHRDMKPQNVIIDDQGEPQVLDFGLAKDTAQQAQLSQANAIMGTPAYMPPEQAQPGKFPVDRRSDVYSLGATLYHCLSGKAPFGGDGAVETIVRVVFEDPQRLSQMPGLKVDPDLEAIIDKSMEKDPAARYQSALEMADDLSRVMNGEHPKARRVGALGRLIRRLKRNRGVVVLVTIAAVLVAGAVGYLLWLLADATASVLRRNKATAIIGGMLLNESAEERIRAFDRVVKADPTWDRGYFQLAVAYLDRALEMDAEDLEKARELRLASLKMLEEGIQHGLGALGYLQRGNTYEEMQLFDKMRADFKTAWELEPDTPVGLQAGAAYALFTNDFAKAEELASRALELLPDNDLTVHRRAEARFKLRKLDDAYADALRACELWETEPEYYLLPARIQMRKGRLDLFAKHIFEAKAVNENHPRLLAMLSFDALRRAEVARAERLADRAVGEDDKRPKIEDHDRRALVYVARARVRLAAGRRDEARADLVRAHDEDRALDDAITELEALEAGPGEPPADADAAGLVAWGWTAFRRGAVDDALKGATRALAKEPKSFDAHDLAARARLVLGRSKEAIAALRVADTPELLALRAWVQLRAGLVAAAGEDARAALAGSEQPTAALIARGAARLAAGEEEPALIDVTRALRADPLDVDALEIRAKCLEAIKDQEGAAEARALIAYLRCEPADGAEGGREGAARTAPAGRGAVNARGAAAGARGPEGEKAAPVESGEPGADAPPSSASTPAAGPSAGGAPADTSSGASAAPPEGEHLDIGGEGGGASTGGSADGGEKPAGGGPPETPVPGGPGGG